MYGLFGALLFSLGLTAASGVCLWLTRYPWFARLQERLGFGDEPEWMR